MRKTSAAGLALVREFEGCRLVAYDDLDPDRVLQRGDRLRGTLTIGHGHTGPDVFIGQRIEAEEAERADQHGHGKPNPRPARVGSEKIGFSGELGRNDHGGRNFGA